MIPVTHLRGGVRTLLVVLGLLLAVLAARPASAACTEGGCFSVGSSLVTVDSTQGPLLNLLMTALLGSNVNLSVANWNGLAQGSVNLAGLIGALQADLDLSSPEEVLDADISVLQLLDAMVDALEADGQTARAAFVQNCRAALVSIPGIHSTIALGTLIVADFPRGSLLDIDIGLLDLVTGAIQLYNYQNVVTTSPITVSLNPLLAPLGLGGLLNGLTVQAQVVEPPTFGCGPVGAVFHTATVRLKLGMSLVDTSVSGLLGANAVDLSLVDLDLYLETNQSVGTLASVDAAAGSASIDVEHGLVDLYLGEISNLDFFDRAHILNPATDLGPAVVGSVSVGALGVANVLARAHARADDPFPDTLVFSGPFPQTKTATSSTVSLVDLVSDSIENDGLLDTLEISLDTVIGGVDSTLLLALVGSLFDGLLEPVLDGVLANLVDPLLHLLGISIGQTEVTAFGVVGACDISGTLYRDFNPEDGARGAGEDWSEGPGAYVNVVQDGVVVGSAAIAAGDGSFTITGIPLGEHTLIVAASGADTSAVAPERWQFVSPGEGLLDLSLPADGNTVFEFGLKRLLSIISGMVFADTGVGDGTAHDIAVNGTEAGQPGVRVELVEDGTGMVLASTTSTGDGGFSLAIPDASAGSALLVRATDLSGTLSVGGNAGDSGGIYNLAGDSVTFTPAVGMEYGGLLFADVPVSRLTGSAEATVVPGTTHYFAHEFVAGTLLDTDFDLSVTSPQGSAATEAVLLLDTDCSGGADAGDAIISGSLSLAAGERACLLVRVFVPAAAGAGTRYTVSLEANATLTPEVAEALAAGDLIQILATGDGALVLVKSVDVTTALPGEVITYTISYRNEGGTVLDMVEISDATPPYTTFASATCGVYGAGLTDCTLTTPASGASGGLTWEFDGSLEPGAGSSVSFTVQLAQ